MQAGEDDNRAGGESRKNISAKTCGMRMARQHRLSSASAKALVKRNQATAADGEAKKMAWRMAAAERRRRGAAQHISCEISPAKNI